jgi:hypothetical protein
MQYHKVRKVKKYKPVGFSLDNAYDSEKIHKVIHEELRASSMIPLKKEAKNGKYRIRSEINLLVIQSIIAEA